MIKIHNDGKKKWQSFRASIDVEVNTKDACQSFQFDGYGKDSIEALQNMSANMEDSMNAIRKAWQAIYRMPIVNVDYKGDEIK